MARGGYKARNRVAPALALGAAVWFVLQRSGPALEGPQINAIPALAACLLALCSFALTAEAFWRIAELFDWLKARRITGLKGTAGFVRSLREVRKDILHSGRGPYWGAFKGREILADYASNALTLGPAGSGKGVGAIQPTILSIRESKTVIDFKGELSCVLARALRERGENVKILNLGDLWPEILDKSEFYNPLVVIADNYRRAGGLRDVSDDLHEMCLQLYPDPEGGKGENKYFHDGSRTLIGFAIQTCVLVQGREATLGDVAQMLNDRESLLFHAQWAAGTLAQEKGAA